MAATVTVTPDPVTAGKKIAVGDRFMVMGTITFDDSYPTGGEAVTAEQFGLYRLDNVVFSVPVAGSRLVAWDQTNKKAKLFTAIGTEASNASDQSTIVAPFIAFGK